MSHSLRHLFAVGFLGQSEATAEVVLAQSAPVGKDGLNLRLKYFGIERLCYIVVGSLMQTVDHKLPGAFCREQDHGEP